MMTARDRPRVPMRGVGNGQDSSGSGFWVTANGRFALYRFGGVWHVGPWESTFDELEALGLDGQAFATRREANQALATALHAATR